MTKGKIIFLNQILECNMNKAKRKNLMVFGVTMDHYGNRFFREMRNDVVET